MKALKRVRLLHLSTPLHDVDGTIRRAGYYLVSFDPVHLTYLTNEQAEAYLERIDLTLS